MARILSDLPLFSLIQATPCLYEEILREMGKEFPDLMKKIKNVRIENLEKAAREMDILFIKPKKSRSAAIAISVIKVATTPTLGVFTIEITLPQFYGEVSRVRKATQKVLGTIINGNFFESSGGGALNIILRGDNMPILTDQHGNNGHAQRFYAARKEIKQ